jgi:hypothetical protein
MRCFFVLLPAFAHAEGIDTEHVFAFMIGSDVGTVGEREFQSTTTGRFSKDGGRYAAFDQEFEVEFLPARNFRVEIGAALAAHAIDGVAGFENRNEAGVQGAALDLRYKFLDRDAAPFGLTLALESHASRIDEISAAPVRNYGAELILALERDVIPNVAVATLNLSYQPEWNHFVGAQAGEQEATLGAAFGIMAQLHPGVLFGGEMRYFRRYEGIGLERLAGQALLVGPTAYFQLSERARLTVNWSVQAWGRQAGSSPSLDLVNFERHQARLVFGANF